MEKLCTTIDGLEVYTNWKYVYNHIFIRHALLPSNVIEILKNAETISTNKNNKKYVYKKHLAVISWDSKNKRWFLKTAVRLGSITVGGRFI